VKTFSVQTFRMNRRSLLRGMGSIAVALPLLDVMEPVRSAQAQSTPAAKRFIVMFSQSGTVYDSWLPTGSERSFQLSPILAPLQPFQSDIVVIGGLRNQAGQTGPGDDHSKGMGSILTGTSLLQGSSLSAGGISLDQEVANAIGGSTKFKSLETGVQAGSGHITNYLSHAGPGQAIPSESDPARVYDRIFGAPLAANAAAPAPSDLLARRKSVLDAVLDSYSSLLPRVSLEDRSKLEAHLDNIRGIEQRLLAVPEAAMACAPGERTTIDARLNDNFPAVARAQIDLVQLAQACDLTRVSTLQFSRESADPRFTWLGLTRGHHAISHDPDSDATAHDQLVAINRWHAEQFAYLLGKLANTREGEGRQMDNTLVLWVNGLAKGNIHSHAPHPNVLAGRAGGALETGRFLNFSNQTPTNSLYVSVLNALGIPATKFGAFGEGPLPGLLA
jgi:Protein of unknown function (DUF1552)